jgi:nucleoside-diphosphate-sugar epimerase
MSSSPAGEVLVTGGLGFLGSSLARPARRDGAHVTVIDNLHPLYGGNRFNIAEVADKIEVVRTTCAQPGGAEAADRREARRCSTLPRR